jgi:hypothetical protein
MPTSNQEFAADLRAATEQIAQVVESLAWLRQLGMAALCDPATPADAIDLIDRTLTTFRAALPGLDAAIDLAHRKYLEQVGRECRPTHHHLN